MYCCLSRSFDCWRSNQDNPFDRQLRIVCIERKIATFTRGSSFIQQIIELAIIVETFCHNTHDTAFVDRWTISWKGRHKISRSIWFSFKFYQVRYGANFLKRSTSKATPFWALWVTCVTFVALLEISIVTKDNQFYWAIKYIFGEDVYYLFYRSFHLSAFLFSLIFLFRL